MNLRFLLTVAALLAGCSAPVQIPADSSTGSGSDVQVLDTADVTDSQATDVRDAISDAVDTAPDVSVDVPADTQPTDTCVPTAEICNGLDDDCDGVVDNNNAFASCTEGGQCNAGSCNCLLDPMHPTPCAPAGQCVDLMTNQFHCGACGRFCNRGQRCEAGQCI